MTKPQIVVEKIATYTGHTDCIYALCAGSTEKEFFTSGGDGMVVLWNTNSGDEGELICKLENSVYTLLFLEDCQLLAVAENTKGIRFLDIKTKTEIFNIAIPQTSFFDLKYHNNYLWICTHNGEVVIVDILSKKIIHKITTATQSARCAVIVPEKNQIWIGYSDYRIRIYDLDNFAQLADFEAHNNSVFSLCYHQPSSSVYSGGRDAHLKSWDINDLGLQSDIPAHLFAINNIVLSTHAEYAYTCSMDKSIKIWDTSTLRLLKVIDKARHASHGTSINKILYLDDKLVSVSDDRKISIWHIQKHL